MDPEKLTLNEYIVYWAGPPFGPNDGSWYHAVSQGVMRERMCYHALTLRGLVETHKLVNFPTTDTKYQMIVDAINFMINQQRDNTSPSDWRGLLREFKNDWDEENGITSSYVQNVGLKELCMAVEYGLDPHDELRPLINKMLERNLNASVVSETDAWHRHPSIENLGEYLRYATLPGLPKKLDETENITKSSSSPNKFELIGNYPNPFNPRTQIQYTLPERNQIIVEIHDILGKKIRTLTNDIKESGTYFIEWNGSDDSGTEVASGIYIAKMYSSINISTLKMMLLK